ncbi:MAG: hypothetical protein HY822_04225 [Acidobacteria bacterium]|nr:hypothetical protein [Acidobacteriota bacterium]
MIRQRKIVVAKCAAVLSVVPALIYAYSGGPPARHTGAPGDTVCTECHVGAANPSGGKVEIAFPGGMTYMPGAKQRLTVTVTDSPARTVNGFQVSARLASNERNAQAGTFTPLDATTQAICEDDSAKPSTGCRATAPLEFIEHTPSGNRTNTWTFEWTPPATDAGNVRFYVAGNSANGNGQNSGDRIFTANYTLTPAGSAAPRPAIRAAQPVLQAFSGTPGLSSGTWLEIYGTNLSPATREWGGNDFSGNRAPTQLDGVGVNVNGKPAFVRYISPTQINVQAPDDEAVGPVRIEVAGPNGTSDAVSMQKSKVSPAVLTTPLFNVGGRQYAAALHPDFQTFVGSPNLIAGVAFRPARPGDTIILFAVGCGATNPATPAGQFFNEARPLALPYQVTFGSAVAQVQGFLAAGAVGLCQFNVTVPNVAAGDSRIDVAIDGVATGQTLYTTVQP